MLLETSSTKFVITLQLLYIKLWNFLEGFLRFGTSCRETIRSLIHRHENPSLSPVYSEKTFWKAGLASKQKLLFSPFITKLRLFFIVFIQRFILTLNESEHLLAASCALIQTFICYQTG